MFYIKHINIFNFTLILCIILLFCILVAIDDDSDVDYPSEVDASDSDSEPEDQNTLYEDLDWKWKEDLHEACSLSAKTPIEGQPANLDRNALEWKLVNFFQRLFPISIITLAVKGSNRYASQNWVPGFVTGICAWWDVDESDIYRFLAIILVMGVVPLPGMEDYWLESKHSAIK